MAFDARVVLSGTCAFVLDGEKQEDGGGRADRATVVLPNLSDMPKIGDLPALRQHLPTLVFQCGEAVVSIPIARREISFEAAGLAATEMLIPDEPAGRSFRRWFPDMALVDPAYAQMKGGALDARPEPEVIARVVFERGYLVCDDLETGEAVAFPNSPTKSLQDFDLVAHRAAVCFPAIQRLDIFARELDVPDSRPSLICTVSPGSGSATVHIGNLCKEDLAALVGGWRWNASPAPADLIPELRDLDFAGLYLLSQAGVSPAPVVPVPRGGGGSGSKCRGARMLR